MSVVTPTILSAGQVIDPAFELLSLNIVKEINRIPYAQIVLLDGDVARQTFDVSNAVFFEPGKPIEIKLRYEDAPNTEQTVFKGIVVKHGVEADAQGSVLTIELKDETVKMTLARKSVIFRDQSDDKIIADIIGNSGLQKGTVAATKAKHLELIQYDCSDWDFMLMRAESNGLLVAVDDGQVSLPEISLTGNPKHTFEYGISEIFNFEIEADAESQHPAVQSIAWDVREQKLTKAAEAKSFNLAQGNLDGKKVGEAVGGTDQNLTNPIPLDADELQAWSDGTMARSRLGLLRGRIAVPGFGDIKPLDVMEVAGIGERFNGKTLVTGIRHRVDQHGWQTDVQFGLAMERYAERTDIITPQAAGLLPAVNGLQIGVVAAFEEDPDNANRVRVILPGIDESEGLVWARLASPDAGKERGYLFRPEPGDEVVVGFFNDDPRQAVILGAMFGVKNVPPEDLATPTQENIDKGIVTKAGTKIIFADEEKAKLLIETPGENKITVDDEAQLIELADQNGNTVTLSQGGIQIKSAKDLKIEASGDVEITGQTVDVN